MDIKEAIQARQVLEKEISAYINERLANFGEQTGLNIDAVYVRLGEMRELGKAGSKNVVTGVDVGVRL